MGRFVAVLAALLALVPDSSAFMLAPSTRLAARSVTAAPAVSSFMGCDVCEREASSPAGGLSMMRHRKRVKKLGKPADQRKALLRSLTTEDDNMSCYCSVSHEARGQWSRDYSKHHVIRHGRIKTTLVRARAVRKYVDKMIGLGKRGDLHARRQAMGYIYDKQLVHALFDQAPERYGDRNGGYCRVLHTMSRQGDNAKMAIIELV